jgi:hypothetical protein
VMNNEGEVGGRTRLSLVFLLDSSGSVGDGECAAVVNIVSVAAERPVACCLERTAGRVIDVWPA